MDTTTDEVLVAVGEEKHGWLVVERTDGSAERGTVPVNLSNGGRRLLEVEIEESQPDAEMAAPLASSDDEGEEDEAAAAKKARDEEQAAADQEEATFVQRAQESEQAAEAARMEADAAECGYMGD